MQFQSKMPIGLVIFDMDGVIADTAEAHKLAWKTYLADYGRDFTEAQFKAIFGTGNKELCPILFPEKQLTEDEIKKIGDDKEAAFRTVAQGNLPTYPGFYEFLEYCDSMNIPLAVGSSACRENVDFILKDLKITNRFITTVSADDVAHAKPAPDIFLKAAKNAHVPPESCLVIEDSLMGIQSGLQAGMRVVALTTTHQAEELHEAHWTTPDFFALKQDFCQM